MTLVTIQRNSAKSTPALRMVEKGKVAPGSLKLTVWPSGDFSIGKLPKQAPDRSPHPLAGMESDPVLFIKLCQQRGITALDEETTDWLAASALDLDDAGRTHSALSIIQFLGHIQERRSGLSVAINPHNVRHDTKIPIPHRRGGAQGLKGITTFGKRMLRSGAALMDEMFGRKRVAFLTCTIPGYSREGLAAICESFPEIRKRFLQELKREMRRHGLPEFYLDCSEIQPKRYQNRGEVAPHLHIAYVAKNDKRGKWLIDKTWCLRTWNRILMDYTSEQVLMKVTTNVDGARGSLKNEIGKYLSKNKSMVDRVIQDGRESELPKSYWGMSAELRGLVKSKTKTVSGARADRIYDRLARLEKASILSHRKIYTEFVCSITGVKREIALGVCGFFRVKSWWQLLTDSDEELDRRIAIIENRLNKMASQRLKNVNETGLAG